MFAVASAAPTPAAAIRPSSVATIAALFPDPGSRIVIPLVARVGEPAKGRFDVVPTPLVVQAAADQLAEECAPTSNARAPVELGDEIVI